MKKYLSLLLLFAITSTAYPAVLSVGIDGSSKKIIPITPDASTGLNSIFVVNNADGCKLVFTVPDGYKASLYKFSSLGGGYAEEIPNPERSTWTVSIPLPKEDLGYILEDGSSRYYCWVTNYSNHTMTLQGVYGADTQDCSYSVLNIEGEASPIVYYTINGQPKTLSREIYLDYTSQEFSTEQNDFVTVEQRKIYESLGKILNVSPPAFCNSYFMVSGDRFLREWGEELTAESGLVEPMAVDCHTEAVQEENGDEASNIMHGKENDLGGSAPADISFYAYTTDGVAHFEWQMSRSQNFDNPEYRFYQQNLDYTFTDEGTFYLRFVGSNYDGTCEAYGDVYTVSIGASALECPNAFSPNDDGVNDVWKVSYRSLIEFHCEIFNRSGQKIFGFDDPSEGWDGTWHGKKVKPGVYYYVINARGADGKDYKKSGDINIIRARNLGNSTYNPDSSFAE